jgi:hypothetical protein
MVSLFSSAEVAQQPFILVEGICTAEYQESGETSFIIE